jgi:cytochrome b561
VSVRNGPHGYGGATRLLHWLTVVLVAAQFFVGYTMVAEAGADEVDCDPPGEARSGGDTTDAEEERLDRIEERCEAAQERSEAENDPWASFSDLGSGDLWADGVSRADVHVLLGLSILLMAVARVLWRRVAGLPPWSDHLSEGERTLVHVTERALLVLLFVVPASGLLLVASDDDDWLPLHIAAHVVFFAVLASHLFTNLRPRILRRML